MNKEDRTEIQLKRINQLKAEGIEFNYRPDWCKSTASIKVNDKSIQYCAFTGKIKFYNPITGKQQVTNKPVKSVKRWIEINKKLFV